MAREKLPKDATIESILRLLDDPKEYVRQVFVKMLAFSKERGRPLVFIGTTGNGRFPNYKIETDPTAGNGSGDILLDLVDHTVAFNGRSHKEQDWDGLVVLNENWSLASMTLEQVQSLLGELRGLTR